MEYTILLFATCLISVCVCGIQRNENGLPYQVYDNDDDGVLKDFLGMATAGGLVNLHPADIRDIVRLSIRDLERHQPTIKHNLKNILDVKQDFQVLNAIRYTVTLLINFNGCTGLETEACASTGVCKISVLLNPWAKRTDESDYGSVVANSCTKNWKYSNNNNMFSNMMKHNQNNYLSREGGSNRGVVDAKIPFGGKSKKDARDPKYFKLAEQSLSKYLSDAGNLTPHRVVRVTNVYTQVVAGFKIHIDFEVRRLSDGALIGCKSEILEQMWLNKKNINVDCQTNGKMDRKAKEDKAGGVVEQDTNDPRFFKLAMESMNKYLLDTGNVEPYKLDYVTKVYTQVVSGTNTIIYFQISQLYNYDVRSCKSEIWEQPWLNKKDIHVDCHTSTETGEGLAGGLLEQDANDPQFFKLAMESMHKYLLDTGNVKLYEVDRVTKVFTQVVSGTNTIIYFKITQLNGDDVMSCKSEIWEQPWLNKKEINVDCHTNGHTNRKHNGGLAGGLVEQDTNDPQFFKLAMESMNKYLLDTGNVTPYKVDQVTKVYTQVVSGTNTIIYFKISQLNNGAVMSCKSEIWEQPWLNRKDINVDCNRQIIWKDKKTKGRLLGGLVEQDASDPKYFKLAVESLNKYLYGTSNIERYKVDKVTKVFTQVVSGFMTYIDFEVSQLNYDTGMSCKSEIWEQPWINKKEIDVNCKDLWTSN